MFFERATPVARERNPTAPHGPTRRYVSPDPPSCVGDAGVLTPIPSFMAFFNQQTLAESASLTGTSLHTGSQVSLRLRPAPVDHGIKFKRMDLPDEPTIDAKIEHVKFVERATTIA